MLIETEHGFVDGFEKDGLNYFLGIPYAGSVKGRNRFLAPRPPKMYETTLVTRTFGSIAPQMRGPMSETVLRMMGVEPASAMEDEDCLNLNVFAPADAAKRPVLFWIHGGFTMSSSAGANNHGDALASFGDVVVVSMNHRLGMLGHLYLGEIAPEYADSGNTSYLDLILALQWVQRNIERFGGDPNNVTIGGSCAGGAKVTYLLASPLAAGLFHKAIIQSRIGSMGIPSSIDAEATERILTCLGASGREGPEWVKSRLTALSLDELTNAYQQAPYRLGPTIDGRFLEASALEAIRLGSAKNIPIIVGESQDDGLLYAPARINWSQESVERIGVLLAERLNAEVGGLDDLVRMYQVEGERSLKDIYVRCLTDQFFDRPLYSFACDVVRCGSAPVYLYRFDWRVPILFDSVPRAPHGFDMLFWLRTFRASRFTRDLPESPLVADIMSSALCEFMEKGSVQEWPEFTLSKQERVHLSPSPWVEEGIPASVKVLEEAVPFSGSI